MKTILLAIIFVFIYIFIGTIITICFHTNDLVIRVGKFKIDPWESVVQEFTLIFLWPIMMIIYFGDKIGNIFYKFLLEHMKK